MKNIIRIEELAITAISIYFISTLPISLGWWAYILLFFAPDISMLGYAVNERVGAFTYNLFHHRGIAIGIVATGFFLFSPICYLPVQYYSPMPASTGYSVMGLNIIRVLNIPTWAILGNNTAWYG